MKNITYNSMVEGAKTLRRRVNMLREPRGINETVDWSAPRLMKADRIEKHWLGHLEIALESIALDVYALGHGFTDGKWDVEAAKLAADYAVAVLCDMYEDGPQGHVMAFAVNAAHKEAAREVGTFVAGLGERTPLDSDDMRAVFEARRVKAKVAADARAKVVDRVILTKPTGTKGYILDAINNRGDLLDQLVTKETTKLGAKLAARDWIDAKRWNADIVFG